MRTYRTARRCALIALALLVAPALAAAQGSSFPPPAGPVTICGTQAAPAATSYELSFDGAANEPITMAATMDSRCPNGSTHSFTLPASRFTVGAHTAKVIPTNAFGTTTTSTVYPITVGVAPGNFNVTGVLALAIELATQPQPFTVVVPARS